MTRRMGMHATTAWRVERSWYAGIAIDPVRLSGVIGASGAPKKAKKAKQAKQAKQE